MNQTKVKREYAQKIRTDVQTPLTSVEQYTGLKLDRLQVGGQVGNRPRTPSPRTGSGLIS